MTWEHIRMVKTYHSSGIAHMSQIQPLYLIRAHAWKVQTSPVINSSSVDHFLEKGTRTVVKKALLHLEGLARKFGNDSFSIKQKDTTKSLTNISQKKKDWQTVHKDAGQVHNKFIDNYGDAQLTSEINF